MRLPVGSDARVRIGLFVDHEETPTDPTDVAVTVTNADGDTLTAPTVTDPAPAAGVVEVTLTADDHLDQLTTLTVVATGTVGGLTQRATVDVDVVGASYVTVAELRGEPDLADAGRVPRQLLADVRDELEDRIEDYVGRAFVPRYHRTTITAQHPAMVLLPHNGATSVRIAQARRVTGDPVTLTVADGDLIEGAIFWHSGIGRGDLVDIGYEHGGDLPPRLVRELKGAIRREVLARSSKAPRDALSQTADGTTTRFSIASPDRPTGIPSLDAMLNNLRLTGIA